VWNNVEDSVDGVFVPWRVLCEQVKAIERFTSA
jgi:hypothetical protein